MIKMSFSSCYFFLLRRQQREEKIHVKCLFVAEPIGKGDERLLVRKDSICTTEKLSAGKKRELPRNEKWGKHFR